MSGPEGVKGLLPRKYQQQCKHADQRNREAAIGEGSDLPIAQDQNDSAQHKERPETRKKNRQQDWRYQQSSGKNPLLHLSPVFDSGKSEIRNPKSASTPLRFSPRKGEARPASGSRTSAFA